MRAEYSRSVESGSWWRSRKRIRASWVQGSSIITGTSTTRVFSSKPRTSPTSSSISFRREIRSFGWSTSGSIRIMYEAGRADVGDAPDVFIPELVSDRHRPEVDLEAHRLGELDEDVLVSAVAVPRLRQIGLDAAAHVSSHLPSTAQKILLAPEITVNVCLKGSLNTGERGTVEAGDDDPGGVDGRRYGGGGSDRHPDLSGSFYAAGPGGSPLRVPARPALRGVRAGGLPARRGCRRADLRRVQRRSGRVARTHGRLPPLLSRGRRCRGARSRRCEERIAWSGADRQLPLGVRRTRRDLRRRRRLALGGDGSAARRGGGAGRPDLRAVRPDQGRPGRARGCRRSPRHSPIPHLKIEREPTHAGTMTPCSGEAPREAAAC